MSRGFLKSIICIIVYVYVHIQSAAVCNYAYIYSVCKHTYNSSFFKRKITRSFSGMSRFGKFFVDSKFDNVVVPNYEIKFENLMLKLVLRPFCKLNGC